MNDDNKSREEKPLVYGDEAYFEASLEIPPQKPEPPSAPVVDTNNSDNDE
jgi:hypothetical protein